MKLTKRMQRGPDKILAESGGMAASFDRHTMIRMRLYFAADDLPVRYQVVLDREEAERLRDNLTDWLERGVA